MYPNLFDYKSVQILKQRIEQLSFDTQAQWGIMNVSQMLAHCNKGLKMAIGELKLSRTWLSYILGRFAKPMSLNDKPYRQGLPTDKNLIIAHQQDFEIEKLNLLNSIEHYYQNREKWTNSYIHPFFGQLTPQEWSRSQYKHLDHHLKQFGV